MHNSTLYHLTILFLLTLLSVKLTYGQEVGAESDVSVEVEAHTDDGITKGSGVFISVSAANSPNSVATSKISGSLSESTEPVPARRADPTQPTSRSRRGTSTNNNGANNGGSEAEAEAEVEAEVEVEVANGAAIAIGGSSAAASGGGRSVYIVQDETGDGINDRRLYPADTKSSANAKTSTATATSKVNIPFKMTRTTSTDEVSNRMRESTGGSAGGGSGSGLPYASKDTEPILQSNTESEVESEAEAEAKAVTAPGAAAAAATGGAATISTGDFAHTGSVTSVRTSTSTSEVNEPLPLIFIIAQKQGEEREKETEALPRFEQGKGTNEAESESEAEAEAEAEVDNNSAAASAVASGAGGSNGIGASANMVASTSAVTSTEKHQGAVQGDNSTFVREDSARFTPLVSQGNRVSADVNNPFSPQGDATARAFVQYPFEVIGPIFLPPHLFTATEDNESAAIDILPQTSEASPSFSAEQLFTFSLLNQTKVSLAGGLGNFEFEDEAEVEAEAEAETGFKAAAASASTTAVHARNGLIGGQGATRTAAATSVFGVNNVSVDKDATVPYNTDLANLVGIDPEGLSFYEVETEAEAEAEVGYQSGAAAAAAAGTGYKAIQVKHAQKATPYAAAAAAGSGRFVTVSVSIPPQEKAGWVVATATASDPEGRGVAVAAAVAGVPGSTKYVLHGEEVKDNEMEDEAEGAGINPVTVRVKVYTDPSAAKEVSGPLAIDNESENEDEDQSTDPGATEVGTYDPDTNLESEGEVEVEAEAEVGYGVAAASIAAGAAGRYTFASGDVAIATRKYEGPYEFFFKKSAARTSQPDDKDRIENLQASFEGKDALLSWQAPRGGKFAVDYLLKDSYFPVGIADGDDQTERTYLFRMLDVSPLQAHTFRVRSLANPDGFEEVLLASQKASSFLLYPNPVREHMSVQLEVSQSQHIRAKVYDTSGKTVDVLYDDIMEGGRTTMTTWIPSSKLPNGLYVLTIEGKDFVEREKVMLAQ